MTEFSWNSGWVNSINIRSLWCKWQSTHCRNLVSICLFAWRPEQEHSDTDLLSVGSESFLCEDALSTRSFRGKTSQLERNPHLPSHAEPELRAVVRHRAAQHERQREGTASVREPSAIPLHPLLPKHQSDIRALHKGSTRGGGDRYEIEHGKAFTGREKIKAECETTGESDSTPQEGETRKECIQGGQRASETVS